MSLGLISAGLLIAALALTGWVVRDAARAPVRPMTAPSSAPFLRRYARQAARERRRVWIKYRNSRGEVIERTVEIYQTTLTGHISGWCRVQRNRATFQRDRILAWQILDERFKRSAGMAGWSRWHERLRGVWGTAGGH